MTRGRLRSIWLPVLMGAAMAAGCASRGPVPGTGDIAFRLTWEGEADLDLYVVASDGERIDFIHRRAASGGVLDIDCNVTIATPGAHDPESAPVEYRKLRCPHPIENVYWPKGRAPEGLYRVQVLLADAAGARTEDAYRLDVRHGRRTHRSFAGNVLALQDEPLSVEVPYPDPAASRP